VNVCDLSVIGNLYVWSNYASILDE